MTQTDEKTETVSVFEVEVRLRVPVPRDTVVEAYGEPEQLTGSQALDVIMEDTDLLPNALMDLLESQEYGWFDVSYEEDEEQPPLEPVRFYKPDEGAPYTLPVPNFISGNIQFTENGIEPIEESPVNVLTDDQLKGAYWAAKRIWGLRGMHRYQQEQMAEFISELQWGMLARPSLHQYHGPEDGINGGQRHGDCLHCGQPEEGHDKPKERGDAG